MRLDQHLVLCDWLWNQLGYPSIREGMQSAQTVLGKTRTGVTDQGASHFLHALQSMDTIEPRQIADDQLEAYDQRIMGHWREIARKREVHEHRDLHLLYFQWLALVFTEHFLELWSADLQRGTSILRDALNAHIASFNARQTTALGRDFVPFEPYADADLPQLAFWCATGSGKTLLMHVQIRQLRDHLARRDLAKRFNRFILITPNEGLSAQHEEEFKLSGIAAERLERENLFSSSAISIIEITKLKETKGTTTIAVDHFGKNNVVLVDEGHRGTGGKEWFEKRQRLCQEGISFEYSATFGQAVHALSGTKQKEMLAAYGKSTLFDYSYKFFYSDGYGKDFAILNYNAAQSTAAQNEVRDLYLTGCLLQFFQQCEIYERDRNSARTLVPYLLENPLMMFVGSSVTGKGEESDVIEIVGFFAKLLANPQQVQERIAKLIAGTDGLTYRDQDANETRRVFVNAFDRLLDFYPDVNHRSEHVWNKLLETVFRTSGTGKLHAILLKGIDEIALRVGDGGEDFGVISVGEGPKLHKLLSRSLVDLVETPEQPLAESLFDRVKEAGSTIHVLVGAKKFVEGWSCWRVSAMGLMNIGKSEGSQIIQLFGRGVRLKGLNFKLQRSTAIRGSHPKGVRELETLHVFGVKADYMETFRDYLEEEDVIQVSNLERIFLPTIQNLARTDLKVVVPKRGAPDFKQSEFPALVADMSLQVVSDWIPRLHALSSKGAKSAMPGANASEAPMTLPTMVRSLVDRERLYQDLLLLKREYAMYNLSLTREAISGLLDGSQDWYKLFVQPERLQFGADGYARVHLWQEIVLDLLKRYAKKFYAHHRDKFLSPYREARTIKQILDEKDEAYAKQCGIENFIQQYELAVDRSRKTLVNQLQDLKALLENGEIKPINRDGLQTIYFGKHLYEPLLHLEKGTVGITVSPTHLNGPERMLVDHLREFCEGPSAAALEGRELFLLRNQSRGRGISFFVDGNFFPDFILWLVDDNRQTVIFLDPHGLRHDKGFNSSKIRFAADVKEIERDLGDANLRLESFVLVPSTTSYESIKHNVDWAGESPTRAGFTVRHVLFMHDDCAYLELIFQQLDA